MELTPVFDSHETARYLEVEGIVEGGSEAAKLLVQKLWDVGIFKRKFLEKALVCPSCLSPNVSNDYVCPNCDSIDIERQTLLEHNGCGTIDSVESFLARGRVKCPKCNVELTEEGMDYRKLGSWFHCVQCGKRFDIPVPIHRCRSCGRIFTIRDTGFVNLYSYRLNSQAETEFKRSHVLMKPIGKVLGDFRFNVEMPGQVVGRSGAVHRFDVVATKGAVEVVVMDAIASEKQVDEVSIASFYAKIFDVAPTRAILIAIPSITDKARKLASLYRVSVIEASNTDTASDEVKEQFGWMGLQGTDGPVNDLQL